MNCPVCQIELAITERQGVEIDYCSQCRGIWLDRGELEKIIERAATTYAPAYKAEKDDYADHYHHSGENKTRHKRKSFFSELFDFD